MGIAWLAVNYTKQEYIDPHGCGSGYKQREILLNTPGLPEILTYLMFERWQGDRVEMVSEYQEKRYSEASRFKDVTLETVILYNSEFAYLFLTYPSPEKTWERHIIMPWPWDKNLPKVLAAFEDELTGTRRCEEVREFREKCKHKWDKWTPWREAWTVFANDNPREQRTRKCLVCGKPEREERVKGTKQAVRWR